MSGRSRRGRGVSRPVDRRGERPPAADAGDRVHRPRPAAPPADPHLRPPGVLAGIFQALGAERINVEDFELDHVSAERGGTLTMLVTGEEEARRAGGAARAPGLRRRRRAGDGRIPQACGQLAKQLRDENRDGRRGFRGRSGHDRIGVRHRFLSRWPLRPCARRPAPAAGTSASSSSRCLGSSGISPSPATSRSPTAPS